MSLGRHVRRDDERRAGSGRTELLALLELSKRLLSAVDPRAAADTLMESVVGMYGFPRVVLVSARGDGLSVFASHGLAAGAPLGPNASEAVSQAVTQSTSRRLGSVDEANEPWLAQLFPGEVDVLIVPVAAEDGWPGALVVQLPLLRPRQWRSSVVEPLEWAVSAAGQALRGLARTERAERMAATDGLTNIANRVTFTAALERELARSSRSGQPISLVILDLDEFKQVNDEHGHQAGDEALRRVAEALATACRDLDTAARYGGEEFVVILPDCGPERSVQVAERLRAAVAVAGASRSLTASAGVASYPTHGTDLETLVRAADDALLVSKRTGRNRTTAATTADSGAAPA
jgi:diguanylate cyclase (GGDEF)-like protein